MELTRRWVAALVMVPPEERESLVAAVEGRIASAYDEPTFAAVPPTEVPEVLVPAAAEPECTGPTKKSSKKKAAKKAAGKKAATRKKSAKR